MTNQRFPERAFKDKLSDLRHALVNASYKTENWIILLLVILNITLRIPITPHPAGFDSYVTIWETKSMINSHELVLGTEPWEIKWVMFTLYGIQIGLEKGAHFLYPFSNPILYQLNYSTLHQFTQLGLEQTLLLISILCGVLGFLTSYLMGREFVENKLMVYVIAFFYSTSPAFLYITSWQGTLRMLFTALFPLILWCFFKYQRKKEKKYIIFSLYLALALFLIHRMGMLLPLAFLGFIFAQAYVRVYDFIQKRMHLFNKQLPYVLPVLYLVFFVGLSIYPFFSNTGFFKTFRYEYSSGLLTEGFQTPRIMLNLVVDYFQNEGLFLILALIGFVIFLEKLKRPVKNINYLVVAFILLFMMPFLLQGEYTTLYILTPLSVLVALGFKGVSSFLGLMNNTLHLNYNATRVFIIGAIILSVSFSILMNNYLIVTPPSEYLQINNYIDETSIAAVEYLDTLPGRVALPLFINLAVHFASRSNYPDKMEFTLDNYGWSLHTIQNILYFTEGNFSHAVEYERFKGTWVTTAYMEPGLSPLLKDLNAEKDKIYSNGAIGVWELSPDPKDLVELKDQLEANAGFYKEYNRQLY